jgi:hypothetical protein
MSAAVWNEPPNPPAESCAECTRLTEQAIAAKLTGDRSRLTDVQVLRARHLRQAHAPSVRA